tara:strand:+ start:63 stop:563 length:501 start_codon:yes stop_codon:yes gene_type:complete
MANPMYGQNRLDEELDKVGSKSIVAVADTTLVAADSGAVVLVNAAAISITLPAAEAGLNFKVIWGIDTTAGADILCTAGDCFFGIIRLLSDTADVVGVPQQITHATAIATVANYDTFDVVAATASLGGMAGDSVDLIAVDDVAWHVNAVLTTSANDPTTAANIVAS